jgi:APA family basic amino acid/polyamine antiporter
MTAFKLLSLAAIIVIAFTVGDGHWSNFESAPGARLGAPPLVEALALGLVSVFFSFAGFWEASRITGEVREPGRTLPRALALGVGCLTLVYLVTTCAFIYLVPVRETTSAAVSPLAMRRGRFSDMSLLAPSSLPSIARQRSL